MFLAHLSQWFMLSYYDRWIFVVRRPSCVVRRASSLIASKDISSFTTKWIWTIIGKNDPYMSLFNNCSNGFGLLYI